VRFHEILFQTDAGNFYLEKQKSFIPKKYDPSRSLTTGKIVPTDGASMTQFSVTVLVCSS
jgi:hypothetical protein